MQVKVTDASQLDDSLKQSVCVVLADDDGSVIDGYKAEFYDTSDNLRSVIPAWKQLMVDKISAVQTMIETGDIF